MIVSYKNCGSYVNNATVLPLSSTLLCKALQCNVGDIVDFAETSKEMEVK
ncbi:MAG: hypothetical protein HFJ07_08975 [Lachnospiraceae bacterium]|jgi:hypothetical protein|nr:hypothetical protein [Lachnospiraceae bacterium]